MKKGFFFRQHTVWLPTKWTVLISFTLLIFLIYWFVTDVAIFLAENDPVPADILIVEGWVKPSALIQAAHEFKSKPYKLLITTGGPEVKNFNDLYDNYAQQAAEQLKHLDIPAEKIMSIPTPASAQNRTYLSAVMVRNALKEKSSLSVSAINIFTADVHARRTFLLYKAAFRSEAYNLGIISAKPEQFSLQHWWGTSYGAKTVITELIGWGYYHCCYDVPELTSYEEMWGHKQGVTS